MHEFEHVEGVVESGGREWCRPTNQYSERRSAMVVNQGANKSGSMMKLAGWIFVGE